MKIMKSIRDSIKLHVIVYVSVILVLPLQKEKWPNGQEVVVMGCRKTTSYIRKAARDLARKGTSKKRKSQAAKSLLKHKLNYH